MNSDFKVGDKVRILTYNEALAEYKYDPHSVSFKFFKLNGGIKSEIKNIIIQGYNELLVELANGNRVRTRSVKKICNEKIKLDKNLFEL